MSEVPYYAIASCPEGSTVSAEALSLPPGGLPVWQDMPEFRTWNMPRDEIHTAESRLGRVAFVGNFFEDIGTTSRALEGALSSGRPERLTEFPGSYTTLLFESTPNRITVLSSISNDPPVYYRKEANGRTSISSRPQVVCSGTPKPDILQAAAQMVTPIAEGTLFGNASSLQGVSKLLGGNVLKIEGERHVTYPYNVLTPDPSVSRSDAAGLVRESITTSLTARLKSGGCSSDLSGIDSGSIAAMAALLLSEDQLPVFYQTDPNYPSGDLPYIQRILQLFGDRFDPHEMTIDSQLMSFSEEDFAQIIWPDDLSVANSLTPGAWKLLSKYYSLIGAEGGKLHLTGEGGDQVVGVGAYYLANLFRRQQFRRFILDGFGEARQHNVSPIALWSAMAQLACTTPSKALLLAAHNLDTNTSKSEWDWISGLGLWSFMGPGIEYLTTPVRSDLAELFRAKADQFSLLEGEEIADFMAVNLLRAAGQQSHMYKHVALASGSEVTPQTPFLDNGVIAAAFLTAAQDRGNAAEYKGLLREALATTVPPEILERRSKGAYKTVGIALRESADTIRDVISNSYLIELGLVDPDKITSLLRHIETATVYEYSLLERMASMEGWFRTVAKSSPVSEGIDKRETTSIKLATASKSTDRTTLDHPEISPRQHHHLGIPRHVDTVTTEGGILVILNQRTKKALRLDKIQSVFFRALADTGNIESASTMVSEFYPTTDPTIIHRDMTLFVTQLLEAKSLKQSTRLPTRDIPSEPQTAIFTSADVVMKRSASKIEIPIGDRLLTAATLLGLSALGKLFPSAQIPVMRVLKKRARRDATIDETQTLLMAAESAPYLGRIACEKAPMATAAAAFIKRLSLKYRRGVSFDPIAFHNFLQLNDGTIVSTPLDGQVIGSFQSVNED